MTRPCLQCGEVELEVRANGSGRQRMYCSDCLKKRAKGYVIASRNQILAEGRCVRCGKPRKANKYWCDKCLPKVKAEARRSKDKRYASYRIGMVVKLIQKGVMDWGSPKVKQDLQNLTSMLKEASHE